MSEIPSPQVTPASPATPANQPSGLPDPAQASFDVYYPVNTDQMQLSEIVHKWLHSNNQDRPNQVINESVKNDNPGQLQLPGIVHSWLHSKRFIPPQVIKELENATFSGTFIPGYLVSFSAEIDYTAERGVDRDNSVFEKDGNGNLVTVVKKVTDWSPSKGHIQKSFDKIEILGNSSLSQDIFNEIGPWNSSSYIPYDANTISKLLIEHEFSISEYKIQPNQALELAKNNLSKEVSNLICEHIGGDHQRSINQNVSISNTSILKILYPVYSYSYTYDNQNYSIMINASTGKLYSSGTPIDKSAIKSAVFKLVKIAVLVVVVLIVGFIVFTSIAEKNAKERELLERGPSMAQKQLAELQQKLRDNPNIEMPEDPWGETIRKIATDDYITLISNGPDKIADTEDDIINKQFTLAKLEADEFDRKAQITAREQLNQLYDEYKINPDILKNLPKDPWGETISATESGDYITFKSKGSDKEIDTPDDIPATFISLNKLNADKQAEEMAILLREQQEQAYQQIDRIYAEYSANPDAFQKMPLDPWGKPITISDTNGFVIIKSNGPDKKPNTADDIGKTFQPEEKPQDAPQFVAGNQPAADAGNNAGNQPLDQKSAALLQQQEDEALNALAKRNQPAHLIPQTILTDNGRNKYDYMIFKNSKTDRPCAVVIKSGFEVLDSNLWCIPCPSFVGNTYGDISGGVLPLETMFLQRYQARNDFFEESTVYKHCRTTDPHDDDRFIKNQCLSFERVMTKAAQNENWLSLNTECRRPDIDEKLAKYCQQVSITPAATSSKSSGSVTPVRTIVYKGQSRPSWIILKDNQNRQCAVVTNSKYNLLQTKRWCIPFSGNDDELKDSFGASKIAAQYTEHKKCKDNTVTQNQAYCDDFFKQITQEANTQRWLSLADLCKSSPNLREYCGYLY